MAKKKKTSKKENEEILEDIKEPETEKTISEEEIIEPKLSEIEKLKIELENTNQKYLRLYSEFDNFRKRTLNEKMELIKNASANLAEDLLTVVDDIDRAVKFNEDTDNIVSIKEGIILIQSKFKKILSEKGIKEMNCIGEEFNTDLHEALTNIPAKNKKQKGKIVDVIDKGYYINEKVLRYAKVIIAN